MRTDLAPPLAFSMCFISACSPTHTIQEPLQTQHEALEHIAIESASTHATLHALVESLLAIQRASLIHDIEMQLLTAGYITPDDRPSFDTLDRDLADPSQSNILLDEIRAGLITAEDARTFLTHYAAWQSDPDPAQPPSDPFSIFSSISSFDATARDILFALDSRADDTQHILAELLRSSAALAGLDTPPDDQPSQTPDLLRTLWRDHVLSRIDDPQKRDAARQLLEEIIAL